MAESESLQKTPLYDEHLAVGGRMVPFAGYSLPVQYTSLAEEHTAVRTKAGLFDVSHMGEVFITGSNAFDFVQNLSCNDHSKLAIGRAQYTGLMYPQGTFVDDMLVHRMDDQEFLLVVNAANRHKDVAYLQGLAEGQEGVTVEDRSDQWAQMAIQGPLASEIAQALTSTDLSAIRYYRFAWGEVAGRRALIARTGYTGEDGFEFYTAPEDAPTVWRALLAEGGPKGLVPAGLGARDTLRFEAGMCLYGQEIDAETTPLEAGLAWIVKLAKGDFIGRDVLQAQSENGTERRLVGFEMLDRGIARHEYEVFLSETDENPAGWVTSGTQSPTFGKALGMAYLPTDHTDIGSEFFVKIRNRRLRARVIKMPFYSRKK
ncbi:MAG: glycine cleavage system aminomethyltransferase GcvT [Acidobacteria bacterium]|nr:MAG: glycine cleavage system aminomethyltransferase GcvT [Acidobacteriota bacterium]